MTWNPLQTLFPKKFLGVDIGTSYIKIVEISKFGHRRKLENYGFLPATVLYEKPFRTFEKNTLLLSTQDIARAIRAIMQESEMKTRQALFSVPDFSTFFTNFELPQMSKEELEQAVKYEARQHIPLPLKEVTLDWQVIKGRTLDKKNPAKEFGKSTSVRPENLKILLVAVPSEVINQYREIARISQLELVALEAEVFSLIRSLIKEDEKGPLVLVDIGARSTTCSIVERAKLESSHSFDISANEFTRVIAKSYNIDYLEAENLKKEHGLLAREATKDIRQILLPLIDVILMEIEKTFNSFYQRGGKEVQKIILAGGGALLPGLKEYFQDNLKKEVVVSHPFADLFYAPILEKTLKKIGPGYAIAVGLALRGWEY